MIEELAESDPALYHAFLDARREHDGVSHFAGNSGRYPLCGRGRINTYALFAELNRGLINQSGRVGIIVPSGIATDDTTKYFFQSLVEHESLVSLFDFENREAIFPGVHRSFKFCLLSLAGESQRQKAARFVFFALRGEHLDDEARRFSLSPQDIALLNPNTKTCPIFRSSRDAELTKAIYRRVPVLVNEATGANPWGISFKQGLFNMTSDSGLFYTREELEAEKCVLRGNVFERPTSTCSEWHPPLAMKYWLPLYEAKMLHHFDHRWATYDGGDTRDVTPEEKASADFQVLARYWVSEEEVEARLQLRAKHDWLLGFRDICRSTDERTVIASILPRVAVGHKAPLIVSEQSQVLVSCFYANLNAFVLDFVARQKVGSTSMAYFLVKQFPVLPPSTYSAACAWEPASTWGEWISSRVLELSYTAHDLEPFARDLKYLGPPFAWDVARRFQLRCELDAAFFHLYGLSREEAAYVLDTFLIVRRKDERDFGIYRTKDEILKVYDEMSHGGAA